MGAFATLARQARDRLASGPPEARRVWATEGRGLGQGSAGDHVQGRRNDTAAPGLSQASLPRPRLSKPIVFLSPG